jgi:hypothetical protein
MESEFRRVGLYAAIGILIAGLIIAGVFLSGAQFPSITSPVFKAQTGTLIVLLTDAPVNLTKLNVTIGNLSAHSVEEGWINLPFVNDEEEVSFNLLALQNVTMELSIAEIPVGNYTKMRMTIKNANATFANGDSEPVPLTVPSGHIDIIIHFEIESNGTTVLLIDMEPDWVAISKTNRLRPIFKADVSTKPS